MIGKKFNRWTVIGDAERSNTGKLRHLCVCECGTVGIVHRTQLITNKSRSCGCWQRERLKELHTTHGKTHTPIFKVWDMMKARCHNPNNHKYPRYGARGITVCDRWRNSFINFYEDMGDLPFVGAQIDRIDNDKGYCLENCRWVTPTENARNKSTNVFFTMRGETRCVSDWCEYLGISNSSVFSRVNTRGWDMETALTTPMRKMRHKSLNIKSGDNAWLGTRSA